MVSLLGLCLDVMTVSVGTNEAILMMGSPLLYVPIIKSFNKIIKRFIFNQDNLVQQVPSHAQPKVLVTRIVIQGLSIEVVACLCV